MAQKSASAVEVAGKDFKALVSAVAKIPSIGGFAGSDLITFHVKDGKLTASSYGVALAKGSILATGEMPPLSVDERLVVPFASIISADAPVKIQVSEAAVFRSKSKEITAAVVPGQVHKLPLIKDAQSFTVTNEIADVVRYLADLAFNDSSRLELCCVYLSGDGKAMAVNQKAVAVFSCYTPEQVSDKIALPLPLARILSKGDTIYLTGNDTVVKSGLAYYAMPAPVKAQKEFPIKMVQQLGSQEMDLAAVCSGPSLSTAVNECNNCLGAVARTEVVLKLALADGKAELSAENGGAKFRSAFKATLNGGAKSLLLPMDELRHVLPFAEKTKTVKLLSGKKNGEVFLHFDHGWAMFPTWNGK